MIQADEGPCGRTHAGVAGTGAARMNTTSIPPNVVRSGGAEMLVGSALRCWKNKTQTECDF